jgi:hypothetical protein
MSWKIAQCSWQDTGRLNTFLAAHWEPFAVSETDNKATVWLRLEVHAPSEAVVVTPQRGPPHEPEVR